MKCPDCGYETDGEIDFYEHVGEHYSRDGLALKELAVDIMRFYVFMVAMLIGVSVSIVVVILAFEAINYAVGGLP